MIYREGRVADYPAITQLISESDYYLPTDAAAIGGGWLVAEHEDEIVGCIWAFAAGVQAYIDYWYVQPRFRGGRVAARLMGCMQSSLRAAGVKFTRGVVADGNRDAARLVAGFGTALDHGYTLAYKEL